MQYRHVRDVQSAFCAMLGMNFLATADRTRSRSRCRAGSVRGGSGLVPAWSYRAMLSIWLALYLAVAAQIAGAIWVRGEHATPEQAATHDQMIALGITDHHGHDESHGAEPADGTTTVGVTAASSPPGTPLVLTASSRGGPAGDSMTQLLIASSGLPVSVATMVARATPAGRLILAGAMPSPPEIPPPIAG